MHINSVVMSMMESVVSEDETVSVENSAAVAATVQRSHQRLDAKMFSFDVRHQLAVGVKKYLTRTTPANIFRINQVLEEYEIFLKIPT